MLSFVLLIFAFIYRLNLKFSNSDSSEYILIACVHGSVVGLSVFALTEDIFAYSKVMVAFLFSVSLGLSLRFFWAKGDFSD